MRRWLPVALCLASLLAAVPAIAQEDDAAVKDHPALARMPGYYIADGQDLDFGAFEFAIAGEKTQQAEGRYRKLEYHLKDGAQNPGPVAIGRNYRNALLAKGGTVLVQQLDNGGGTMSARATIGGKRLWVQVEVSNGGEAYMLHIIEEQGMAQQIELNADGMARALKDTGHVAVHGILFDTGKATVKPESAAVLGEIATLLNTDASLTLEIQGHTDNVGAPAANLKLSQDRALAVKDYVVTKGGIAAARLTTAGFGDTKPVAPNTTDEGRAQNRRVELVKR